MKTILTLTLFLLALNNLFSQKIRIIALETKNYPQISAMIVTKDNAGKSVVPILNEISVTENTLPVQNLVLNCPQRPATVKPISLVITLDNSGSMANIRNGEQNMEIAKRAALKLISELPSSNVEVAITSFDGSSLLWQDFTSDKSLLIAAVNSIFPAGSTNYDAGLLLPPSGALNITKNAKYARNIIFLTDGESTQITEQSIINEALLQQCKINVVCLRTNAKESLKNVAISTNGLLFENVQNTEEIEFVFTTLLEYAQGIEPCTLTWNSPEQCENIVKNVTIDWLQSQDSKVYFPPSTITPLLTFSPYYAELPFNGIGVVTNSKVTITNVFTTPLTVTSIQSTNPNFTVIPTSFTLNVGQSIDVQVSTTATDSTYQFTTLTVNSNSCPVSFYAAINRNPSALKTPLVLQSPNGGETFIAGVDTIIRWKNVAPSDTVSLYYSTDNGKTWTLITNTATNLQYRWKIPSIKSDSCLVKVEFSQKPKRDRDSNNVSIYYKTSYITDAVWNKDGRFIYYLESDKSDIQYIKVLDSEIEKIVDSIPFIDKSGILDYNNSFNLLAVGYESIKVIDPVTKSVVDLINFPAGIDFINPTVSEMKWSPNGQYLAICFFWSRSANEYESYILVYDFTTKTNVFTYFNKPTTNNYLRALTWHPNSKLLAMSATNSEISILDIDTKNFTLEFSNNPTLSRREIAWSPDGTQIMSACGIAVNTYTDNENILYNAISGNVDGILPIRTFSDNIEYHPFNKTIAIDSSSKVIIVHDKSLSKLQTLLPPNFNSTGFSLGIYANVKFSPDGTRLMAASSNNDPEKLAIIVWEIDDTNSQVDISDSVFRIVVPEFKTQAIDMGKVIVGSAKDSVITPFIENTSESPFAVNEIRIIGPDASAFSLVSGTPVYTISAFSSSFGEFQFVPNRVGIHNAFVEVITQADSVVIPIQGEGIQDAIAQATKIIDFGTIDVFTRKDSLNVTTISAVSATPIQVTNARIEGGSASSFSILSPFAGNTTITSTDTLKLDLQFFAQSVGRVQSQLILDHSGVGSPSVITLFGNGRDTAIGNLRIVAPELTAKTNNFLKIPIYLENTDNLTFSSNAIVDFNLRFNSTILTPRTINAQSTIANGERSVPLSFPLQPDSNGVIGTIDVRVGLGNATSTPLTIDSVRVRNSSERIGKRDGLVTIIDICEEGGTRLVNSSTKVGLALMSAVPVSQQIELKLTSAEKGITTIQLFDVEGKLVSELWNGTPIIGDTYLTVRASNYPNGTYFLLLKTPTVQETIPFIIQR